MPISKSSAGILPVFRAQGRRLGAYVNPRGRSEVARLLALEIESELFDEERFNDPL